MHIFGVYEKSVFGIRYFPCIRGKSKCVLSLQGCKGAFKSSDNRVQYDLGEMYAHATPPVPATTLDELNVHRWTPKQYYRKIHLTVNDTEGALKTAGVMLVQSLDKLAENFLRGGS